MPKRSAGLLVFLLLAAGGILSFVLMNSKDRADSKARSAAGPNLRLQGVLKPGTLRRLDDACEYHFTLRAEPGSAKEIQVRFPYCTVPDTLREFPGHPTEVIAEGKLSAPGHFEASQIMVRSAWMFEMNERATKGELAPHAVPSSL